jgi:DNA-binding NarL/FixJ family response regulator
MAAIRVLLLSRNDTLYEGLRSRLAGLPQIVLCDSGDEGELCTAAYRPRNELILIDASSYPGRATSLLCRIVARDRQRKALLLYPACTDALVDHVLRCGGSGCLTVHATGPELARAIQAVHAGELWASRSVLSRAFRHAGDESLKARPMPEGPHSPLSSREREIVAGMVQMSGRKQLAVADALGMSEHTLRNHLTAIYAKLGVHGRLELHLFATEHGLGTNQ